MQISSKEDDVKQLLFELQEAQAAQDWLAASVQTTRDNLIPDKVQMELAAYDDEVAPVLKAAKSDCASIKKRLSVAATSYGQTVRGERLQAIVFERPSWDDDGLRRFLASVLTPDVLKFALQQRTVKMICQVRVVK